MIAATASEAVPTVSIVLATCNRLSLLRLAVDSVLAQTYTAWELIIADDGSEQATRDYLRELHSSRVQVFWLEHCGNPGTVRNAALARARGTYVAFMDSDDLWMPTKLERQIAALRAAPGRRWSYTAYDCIDGNGDALAIRWAPHDGEIFGSLLRAEAMVALPTVMAERALLHETGGFDPDQLQAEDIDLWLRMALRSDVLVLDRVLTRVRFHQDHYCRGGTWGLSWLRRLYEKIERLAPDAPRRALARRARTWNAARLMRAHAAAHDWRSLAAIARDSWDISWRSLYWWRSLAMAMARLLMPDRWLRGTRRIGQTA